MQASDAPALVTGVSCGSSHSVALLDCGVVVAWGRGEDGQLGLGDADQQTAPKALHALLGKDVSSVVCGAEYTIAVSTSQQQLYSWGWGDFGRLGHGDCNDVFLPQAVAFFSGAVVKQVACGDTHTLVVNAAGQVHSFGRNQNGQLGQGHTSDVLSPKRVAGLLEGRTVVSAACGAEHSVVATSDGEVFAWGWGRYGNLGNGEREDRHLPTPVDGLEGVAVERVACGWRHSAAVSREGDVYTFGWSKYGQLGLGDTNDRLQATKVTALAGRPMKVVAGGWRHTMAVDHSGAVFAWGWNKFGQLGVGDTADRLSPTEVAGLAAVSQLACGWRHCLAVTAGGEVYSWGRGVNGQLGLGDERDQTTPVRLDALSAGTLRVGAIIATATAPGGYVAPADRYAVVPDGDGGAPLNGADGGGLVPEVPSSGDGADLAGGGGGAPPLVKKPRTAV